MPVRKRKSESADRPEWLQQRSVPATVDEVTVRILGRTVVIEVWSPGEGAMPLLLAHDGPEYDERAGLTRYAGATIAREAIAPFRIALLPPGSRDEWYSASAAYGRSLCRRIIPAIADQLGMTGRPVGMGASLGALAMLQAQRAWPETFGGLFLQSGSFFTARFDGHESGFSRYGRIVRFARGVLRSGDHAQPVPVRMTCGAQEENVHNNRLIAGALAAQGYDVGLAEVRGGHDWTAWRAAFDPHLTALLAEVWPA
jgi:enterochelin esterase-like enzyme